MDYLGLLIHAALLLRRYENSIIRESVDPLFEALAREIAIAARPSLLGVDRARIAKVLELVYARLRERAGADLVLVAEAHARKVEAAVEHRAPTGTPEDSRIRSVPVPKVQPGDALSRTQPVPKVQPSAATSRARQILDGDSFDGATWKRWNEIQREKTVRDTQIQISLSRNAKESPAELQQRLLEKVTRPAQLRARALTRTFALNVSNALQWEDAEADPRVKGYRLLVVLDGRTSLICINYAAEHKFYLFTPGNPRPPFHYNCRTVIYPVIVGRENEKPRDAEKWFAKKSNAEQDELLGPERAAMYRAGEISLSGLINSENRVLDLAELRGVSSSSGIL